MSKNKISPAPLTDLVFIKPEGSKMEPYTTHEIIAVCAGVTCGTVTRLIRKHKTDLEEFGVFGFEIRKPIAGSPGGRPEKIWHFNEQQATLFITYLQNTAPVRKFKKELVAAFYTMRQELTRRKELRTEGKPIRRSLTDALRDSGEVERMKGHAYAAYTNLAYKLTTGRSSRQLRKERGAGSKAVAADFLTSDELERYHKQEYAIAALLDVGLDYPRIRVALAGSEDFQTNESAERGEYRPCE